MTNKNKHEKVITPEKLREILDASKEAAPGDIKIDFVLPAGHWLITWTDYRELNY